MDLYTALLLLAAFVLLWITTMSNRDREWAVFCWLPVVLISGLGSLAILTLMMKSNSAGPSAEGGFYQLGDALVIGYLLPCPVIFVCSLIFYPKTLAYDSPRVIARSRSKVRVVFLVRANDHQPLPGVMVNYEVYSSSELAGSTEPSTKECTRTSDQGIIAFPARDFTEIRIRLSERCYVDSDITIKRNAAFDYVCVQEWMFPPAPATGETERMRKESVHPAGSIFSACFYMLTPEDRSLPVVS